MNNDERDLLMDHEADGIKELDNNLPRWWVWLFYLTTAFAIFYMTYFHVFKMGNSQAAEYAIEQEHGEVIKQAALSKFEATIGAIEPLKDKATLAKGQDIFLRMCAPCHRADAGGLVGPNLTDDFWLHGDKFTDNVKTIVNGVPEKGMLTWKGVLQPAEIHAVASYVYTLRSTHPPNPKPPENQNTGPQKPSEFE
jgi:cytochrome c oxidase cbb3-type subunit 3